jgi:hypothetical protein
MNGEIMEENVSLQIETNMNLENEREKQMNLAITWKIVFVLDFLLC